MEGRTGLSLAPSQAEALRLAVEAKVLVITGGPGVGKTTLVNAILKVIRAKGVEVALCAPTGRAAKRLTESTGLEARTIHRLLEADPGTGGFRRGEEHPLDCDLLVLERGQHGRRTAGARTFAGAAALPLALFCGASAQPFDSWGVRLAARALAAAEPPVCHAAIRAGTLSCFGTMVKWIVCCSPARMSVGCSGRICRIAGAMVSP